MGRVKNEIPQGSFFLRPRANSKGERALYLRYFVCGKYAMRSCDIWLSEEDWDQKGQVVKNKNKQAAQLNLYLKNMQDKVDKQILDFSQKGGIVTQAAIQGMLDGNLISAEEKAKNKFFIPYCLEVNDLLHKREKFGASVWYNNQCYIKQFEKFLRKKMEITELKLNDMSLDYINRWISYQIEDLEKKSRMGINHTLTPLLNAIRYAKEEKLFDPEKALYILDNAYMQEKSRDYRPDAHVTQHRKVKYLTEEQLAAFKAYKPKNNRSAATRDIMDIFLFSYYSSGLRISDIVTLEWSQIDFDKCTIDKVQVKTKNKGKIPPHISSEGMAILERWKKRPHAGKNRFVFNLLPDDFDFSDQLHLKMKINSRTRNINQSLNAIGENLGFPDKLSIHMARHTFCVHAISKGASLHFVSQLMGHESIKVTEKVYAEFLQTTIDTEMDKLKAIYG